MSSAFALVDPVVVILLLMALFCLGMAIADGRT